MVKLINCALLPCYQMKYLLIAPVVGMMMLGFLPELLSIAEDTQDKTIAFADDMNSAIDCATRALPLELCSPGLSTYDWTPEINRTMSLDQRMIEVLEDYDFNASTVNIDEEKGTITIIRA
jgi:hypothetical protein